MYIIKQKHNSNEVLNNEQIKFEYHITLSAILDSNNRREKQPN